MSKTEMKNLGILNLCCINNIFDASIPTSPSVLMITLLSTRLSDLDPVLYCTCIGILVFQYFHISLASLKQKILENLFVELCGRRYFCEFVLDNLSLSC